MAAAAGSDGYPVAMCKSKHGRDRAGAARKHDCLRLVGGEPFVAGVLLEHIRRERHLAPGKEARQFVERIVNCRF